MVDEGKRPDRAFDWAAFGNVTLTNAAMVVRTMKTIGFALVVALLSSCSVAQDNPPKSNPPAKTSEDYSGMYSFLREGEFVQMTAEDQGRVSGFVSRFGDLDSDRGAFLDHFFKEGRLDGNRLSFTTETVHR
jgi:hypothetical protein